MIKKIAVVVLSLSIIFPAIADILKVKNNAPEQYVVKKGDTLWDISAIYLEQPWLWPKLWRFNPQIDNPHLIYPGDTLSLVYDADGRPMLVMNQKYKKLSPHGRKVMKKDGAIPTLPLELIRPYLTYEQALDEEYMAKQPYVLGGNDNVKNLITGHILYIKGNLVRSKYYGIYRKGEAYIDPKTDEPLAHEAILVGTARAFRNGDIDNGIPASVRVKNAKREIHAGDFLIPAMEGQSLPAFFSLTKPEKQVDGSIIASTTKLREFSKLDIVVLNLGKKDKLKAGHILDIRRQSPTVVDSGDGPKYLEDSSRFAKMAATAKDLFGSEPSADNTLWKMPKEKVGELMVFKVYNNLSYALVTGTLRPIRVGDVVSID
ncbi:LysM peptidoglycan-binding domain-containing protein [Pseudoalteromonas denitrificans]|uniref:LysM domain-containing protein n=1 Tax=Pseudoalteromonas denitrificans DSM 6059 TaxID=1123010 RepID=A0A1I1JNP2_9GAMM|nr:LysM peptidoglycan-binding domain-containing protein [Pseudoalteromonas denitrificans]SFC50227.1 LysM domain-containing protein [Pseudoalteromonas denitrificans DSM 6059]